MQSLLRLHVLSDGFRSPNGRAFVFPLLVNAGRLQQHGIAVRVFDRLDGSFTECDVLAIDSKFFRAWWSKSAETARDTIGALARQRPLLWFDTTDSAGGVKAEVLPLVKAYYKNQLYRDRNVYRRGLYGLRLYTDHYHAEDGIADREPAYSDPIPEDQLDKLRVGWNSGLSDYSLLGPYKLRAFELLKIPQLLRYPQSFTPARAPRAQEISCRFGITYDRDTVAYQRQEIRRRLSGRLPTDKLNRFGYFRELRTSRIIVSPFGLGEITLKDYEVFLTGGLLLKPSMAAVETWPDLFQDRKTMLPISWNLDDLEAQISAALADTDMALAIAEAGQTAYRQAVTSDAAQDAFCRRIASMIAAA